MTVWLRIVTGLACWLAALGVACGADLRWPLVSALVGVGTFWLYFASRSSER